MTTLFWPTCSKKPSLTLHPSLILHFCKLLQSLRNHVAQIIQVTFIFSVLYLLVLSIQTDYKLVEEKDYLLAQGSKTMVHKPLGVIEALSGSLSHQNYSHNNNINMLFAIFTMLTFAMIVQKQQWTNLLTPWPESKQWHQPVPSGHCPSHHRTLPGGSPVSFKDGFAEAVTMVALMKSGPLRSDLFAVLRS